MANNLSDEASKGRDRRTSRQAPTPVVRGKPPDLLYNLTVLCGPGKTGPFPETWWARRMERREHLPLRHCEKPCRNSAVKLQKKKANRAPGRAGGPNCARWVEPRARPSAHLKPFQTQPFTHDALPVHFGPAWKQIQKEKKRDGVPKQSRPMLRRIYYWCNRRPPHKP